MTAKQASPKGDWFLGHATMDEVNNQLTKMTEGWR